MDAVGSGEAGFELSVLALSHMHCQGHRLQVNRGCVHQWNQLEAFDDVGILKRDQAIHSVRIQQAGELEEKAPPGDQGVNAVRK